MKKSITIACLLSVTTAVVYGQVESTKEASIDRSWTDRLNYLGMAVAEKDYHVWGSSPVIDSTGKTHLFVSRWPISEGFGAWLTHCEIARYMSESPEGPFKFQEVIVKGSGKKTWDHQSPHNPNVQKVGNRYALTYIANAGGEKKERAMSQRIGMMIADHPSGPWKKVGKDGLILSPPSDANIWSHQSTVGVNNPALFPHPDGRIFLYYKAMKKDDIRRMGLAIADTLDGPYTFQKEPLTSNDTTIEDGYVFQEKDKIFLITTHNDAGAGYLWESTDGINFDPPIPGFDKLSAYVSAEQIGKVSRGKKFERPQVLMINGKPQYLYVALGANLTGGSGSVSCIIRIKDPK